jgi:hypothetical protein
MECGTPQLLVPTQFVGKINCAAVSNGTQSERKKVRGRARQTEE